MKSDNMNKPFNVTKHDMFKSWEEAGFCSK